MLKQQCLALAVVCLSAFAAADTPSHDAFTYQGQLKHNGEPVMGPVNFAFRLYDADLGGEQVGSEIESFAFDGFDDEGRFTIDLAFGKGVFDGTPLWLEIRVNGGLLSPRQPIVPTPYSIRALDVAAVADGAFGGTYTNALTLNNPANQFSGAFAGSGAGLTSLDASNIATGTLGGSLLSGNYTNAVTFNNPGNQFAGNGAGLTSLNASNITAGNLSVSRMPVGGNWSLTNDLKILNGRVAIGTSATQPHQLHVVSSGGNAAVIYARSTATSGTTYGVEGEIESPSGHAVRGFAWSASGQTRGVVGAVMSTSGIGVSGSSFASSGQTRAVSGEDNSTSGTAVYGQAWALSGTTYGVYGRSRSTSGTGVRGWATSNSGTTYGVHGQADSPDGYAGYFVGARNYFSGRVGIGTESPEAQLHIVRATSVATPQVLVHNSSATGFSRLRMANDEHEAYWDIAAGGSNNYLDFFQSIDEGGGGSILTLRGDTQRAGVRTQNPAFTLHVNGDAGKPGGGSWATASDARLKQNIRSLPPSLDRLLALQGVTFEYRDHEAIHELPGQRIGMIAQDVAQVFPDWVDEAADGYLRLTFRGFEAVMVEALRELRDEKDAQVQALREEKDAEIAALQEQIQELRDLVNQLANRDSDAMR